MRQPAIKGDSTTALPAYRPAVPVQRKLVAVVPIANPRRRCNARGEKMVTVARLFDATATRNDPTLPMIRLRGRWLQRLGFKAGERIVVSEEHGRIVLTLAGEEER